MDNLYELVNKDCSACTMSFNCNNICSMVPKDVSNVKLMIVSDLPYSTDTETKALNHNLLNAVIEEVVNIPEDAIYRTSIVKCLDRDYSKPSDLDVSKCMRHYLYNEIAIVKPKAILVLGEAAMVALTGLTLISKHRGKHYDFKLPNSDFECKIIPTFSPAYVARLEGANLKNFAMDIQNAYYTAIEYVPEIQEDFTKVVICDTLEKVDEALSYVKQTKRCTFDFESSSLEWWRDEFFVTGLALTFQQGSGYFIPIDHREPVFNEKGKWVSEEPPIFDKETQQIIINKIAEVMYDYDIVKIAHNAKFDINVAARLGITIRGRLIDTMTMHHCIYSIEPNGLEEITAKFFPSLEGYKGVIAKYGYDKTPLKILAKYAVTDTDVTDRIATYMENILMQDTAMYRHYRNLVVPTTKVLQGAEFRGIKIDMVFLEQAIKDTEDIIAVKKSKLLSYKQVLKFEAFRRGVANQQAIDKYQESLDKLIARGVSADSKSAVNYRNKISDIKSGVVDHYEGVLLSSPAQMTDLLYSDYGFGYKKTKDYRGNEVSGTGKDVLSGIKDKTGFVDELLVYRSLEKMLATYLLGIKNRVDSNGYIHTSFGQLVLTGRLSSSNPNLQNIPRASKLNDEALSKVVKSIKRCFIPYYEDETLISNDLSQAELRLIAFYAQDETMMMYYRNNYDLHTMTAIATMKTTLEEFQKLDKAVQKEWRSKAKPVNFGFIYGMGYMGLIDYAKNNYGVVFTEAEAKDNRDTYFRLYNKLETYHRDYIRKAHKYGYVRTLFGRRVYLQGINSPVPRVVGEAERTAINAPIQGSSGEWTEFGLVLLDFRLPPESKFVNTVHDSIMRSTPEELVSETIRITELTLSQLPVEKYFGRKFEGVPMKSDAEVSKVSWADLEEYKAA